MANPTDRNVSDQTGENPEQQAAAEKMNSMAQDTIEQQRESAEEVTKNVKKSPDEVYEDMERNAPTSGKRLKEKITDRDKKKASGKTEEKFEISLDKYVAFVDRVSSKPTKNFADLMARYQELNEAGCEIQRLDTAASGISAEGGEFMEIVKKLKFQGKPWDTANKEHLAKELGDVMWYVAQACIALDMRLDEVLYLNTLKLAARYPAGAFDEFYSENRAPGDI
tara:strand:- start:4987 stop:5658 length:672 start_codon:yes stop_codon:yes gene_type:complete